LGTKIYSEEGRRINYFVNRIVRVYTVERPE